MVQRLHPELSHLLLPYAVGLASRFQLREARPLAVRDDSAEPLDLDGDDRRGVDEQRRTLGPVEEEHVGELVDGDSEMRLDTFRPGVFESDAIPASDIQALEPAGLVAEPRGQNDGIELDRLSMRADARLRDGLDWLLANVHNLHLRLIHDLVEVLFQAGPLDAKGEGRDLGDQQLSLGCTADPGSRLLSPEGVRITVGLEVLAQIPEPRHPEGPASLEIPLLVEEVPLLGRNRQRVLVAERVVEAIGRLEAELQGFSVVIGPHPQCLSRPVWAAVLAQGETWSLLVDCHGLGDLADRLDDLNPAGPRTNDSHLLAAHVHGVARPSCGVIDRPAKPVDARNPGDGEHGREPYGWDEPLRIRSSAIFERDGPSLSGFRVLSPGNRSTELEAGRDSPLGVNVLKVPEHLCASRELLSPSPVPEKLCIVELVERERAVDCCPGVGVLTPNASEPFLALESADSKP